MLNKVKENIKKYNLVNNEDNVILGLSGGPDSIFLFHILRILKEELRFNLYATHINHLYRGKDAYNDENFVNNICSNYNIKLFILRKNSSEYARNKKVTEEEAGREIRYNFYNKILADVGGGKIAVAHNMNDQAETVLQRIIRGTGTDGLKAMDFINGNIIRPILNISRKEIEDYLEKNDYKFCTDKTNSMSIYGRNKVRLELIPYLEDKFNPNIKKTLFRMSEVCRNDSMFIDKYATKLYKESFLSKGNNTITLRIEELKNKEDYEVIQILRKAISDLKGNTINVENKHINYALKLINENGKTGKIINLADDLYIQISYNNLIIGKTIENTKEFEYNIEINNELFIKEVKKKVLVEIVDNIINLKNNTNTFYFDFEKIKGNLQIRNRRNGDKMIPYGMKGTKKVKDIFIDNKVSRNDRYKKLILTDDNSIIWLEDFRISDKHKISSNTKKYLKLQVWEDRNGQYN